MREEISVLFTEEQIARRVAELARRSRRLFRRRLCVLAS